MSTHERCDRCTGYLYTCTVRYLCEEHLEVQIWLTVRLPGQDSDCRDLPRADDQLVGAAQVPLVNLMAKEEEARSE